jgi:predicted metal-dependent phosphoesterase TrpH
MTYVELHAHSAYSFLDGASQPEELVARAAELGYEALALTDHDGVYGSLEFAHAAKHFGVRPITGAEVTLADGSHVTLLVEDACGYANLCRLLTAAHAHTRPAAKRPVRVSGPVEGVWGNREVPRAPRARPHPKNARATSYHSGGTVLSSAVASASETSTIASPRRAAICPNRPSWTRSAAFSP